MMSLTPRLWHKSDIHTGITGNSCGMVLHSYWLPCAVVWMPKAALLLAKPNAKLGQGTTSESANVVLGRSD